MTSKNIIEKLNTKDLLSYYIIDYQYLFEALFRQWVRGIIPRCHGVIAFDGRTIRVTDESEDGRRN